MRLLIVNPNSTQDMTDRIGAEARGYLPEGIELILRTNLSGPPSIQGAIDGDMALPGTLSLLLETQFDAAIVGCFDDTGLAEAAASLSKPVIGLGEAAARSANEAVGQFAILTTSELSVPVIAKNMETYGLLTKLNCVRASQIDVLDFETDRAAASNNLTQAAKNLLIEAPDIRTIVLGCAGMGGLAEEMASALNIDVIDPIKASVNMAIKRCEARTPSKVSSS